MPNSASADDYDGPADAFACWQLAVRELRKEFLRNMKATDICARAADLVGGDREATHGDKVENHQNIARLWNAYLGWRLPEGAALSAKDVALMMALLKIARTKAGAHNPDDYIDLAGYAGVAGEIASREQS